MKGGGGGQVAYKYESSLTGLARVKGSSADGAISCPVHGVHMVCAASAGGHIIISEQLQGI